MDVLRNNPAQLGGLEQLRGLMAAGKPPPMMRTLSFAPTMVEPGKVVFEGSPGPETLNPIGSVHGGYAATLLDSACGAAVHTRLGAHQGFTTLELKVAYHHALTPASGPVDRPAGDPAGRSSIGFGMFRSSQLNVRLSYSFVSEGDSEPVATIMEHQPAMWNSVLCLVQQHRSIERRR